MNTEKQSAGQVAHPYPYIPVHTDYEVLEGVFLNEKNPNLFSALVPSSSSFNTATPLPLLASPV
jgi:hypothetical protein